MVTKPGGTCPGGTWSGGRMEPIPPLLHYAAWLVTRTKLQTHDGVYDRTDTRTDTRNCCYLRQTSLCFLFRLFVCPSDNWKSCERILTKFLGGIGHGPGTNEFNFGDDPDHRPDPGVCIPKSAFTGLSKLPTDFDEILWGAGVWPIDQLLTFWWRSTSLSGSGSPFRITIREELAFSGGLWSLSTSSFNVNSFNRWDNQSNGNY